MSSCSCQRIVIASLIVCSGALLRAGPLLAEESVLPDVGVESREVQPEQESGDYRFAHAHAGYQFITPDGATAAAAPYTRLKSGVSGGLSAGLLDSGLKLSGEAVMLNEDDYHTNLFLDYGGYYRLHLESEAFWHNLLAEQLPLSSTGQYATSQASPPAGGYGLRTGISQVENRIKLGNNPIHITLGYWQLSSKGTDQLLFGDYFSGNTQSSMISVNRQVDRITREGSFGADAHLGFFDIAYGFRIRDFSNLAPDIRYPFAIADNGITSGNQAVDVISDSRVISHTIRLYTDLSGGLTGTAAYALTRRENSVDRGDARPSSNPAETLQSIAGDLTYTPLKELSFALKYRRLQTNLDSPATVSYPFASAALQLLPAINTAKDSISLAGTYRPCRQMTFHAESRAVLESRENVPDSVQTLGNPAAIHNEFSQTYTNLATATWRPRPDLRVNAAYTFSTTINPVWETSAVESHKGELFVTYSRNGVWGTTANLIASYEQGENSVSTISPAPAATYEPPRMNRLYSANESLWFTPVERLTITVNYSYLGRVTDQSLLFANTIINPDPLLATTYRSSAYIYGIDAAYAVSEPLDLSLGLQQVRSASRFDVPVQVYSLAGQAGSYDTTGITSLTRLDTVETGVTGRAEWHISRYTGCSVNYSFRHYNSGDTLNNGSVHTIMALLTSRW